jgi:hypothetical protein
VSGKPWSYPENTEVKLFISQADDSRSFGSLLSDIRDHFGSSSTLAEFDIEFTRWTLEDPCSCCRDSGVYGNYWEITRRDEPCEYTVNHQLSDLYRE